MNPEQTTDITQTDVQPQTEAEQTTDITQADVQPQTEATTTTMTTTTETDYSIQLQSIHETMIWSVALQVVIMCVLLVQLFFSGLKAGKS